MNPLDPTAEKLSASRLAWTRLKAGDFQDDEERQRLVHEAWPWEQVPKGEGLGLRCTFDKESKSVVLNDYGGYLTTILTATSLWEVLEMEAESPGFIRRKLTKIEGRYPSKEEVHAMILEEQHKITKLPPSRKTDAVPDFEMLELDL